MMLAAFTSCANRDIDYGYTFADKTYIYEKEGAGGSFIISIKSDGTFTYTEGPDSNYLAHGIWTYINGTLSLIDDIHGSDRSIVNNFFYVDGNLWYITEGSTGFSVVTVEESDIFTYAYPTADATETAEE